MKTFPNKRQAEDYLRELEPGGWLSEWKEHQDYIGDKILRVRCARPLESGEWAIWVTDYKNKDGGKWE